MRGEVKKWEKIPGRKRELTGNLHVEQMEVYGKHRIILLTTVACEHDGV